MSKIGYTPEHPLLFDGAMGTLFAALPGRVGERCEEASLTHPGEISAIHHAYLEAGARAIKTNTFGLGTELAQGNEALAGELIAAASRLALEAAAPYGALVFADLGPIPGDSLRSPEELFLLQAEQFVSAGVTHFLVETLSSDEGIPQLAAWLEANCPEAFLIVSFAVGPDGFTREGLSGRALLKRTAALPGVDGVGFNCMSGPHHLLSLVRGLELEGTMLSVMPNAGYPTVLGRRTAYQGTPDYFAQQMAQILRAGASIAGGCCGTTPEHIAALGDAVAAVDFSAFAPPERDPDVIPCASEKEARFITPDVDVGETIECSPDLMEDILAAEEEAPQGALKIAILEEDDLDIFAENQYVVKDALCLWSDVPELLEKALRLYQGRAFWDGTGDLDDAFLEEMSHKYGLVLL